jgi:hypothetical protein
MVSKPFLAETLSFFLKVNWDVSIELKHALVLVGSDAPKMLLQ